MVGEIIGWLALGLSISVLLPQIVKTFKSKDVSGLSQWMYIQLVIACSLFITKALISGTPFFAISYSVTGLSSIVMIGMIFRYGKRKRRKNKEVIDLN